MNKKATVICDMVRWMQSVHVTLIPGADDVSQELNLANQIVAVRFSTERLLALGRSFSPFIQDIIITYTPVSPTR